MSACIGITASVTTEGRSENKGRKDAWDGWTCVVLWPEQDALVRAGSILKSVKRTYIPWWEWW